MTSEAKAREGMPKAYNPAAVERRLYERWENAGYFTAHIDPDREPFTIVMPPPNLTGELHLGHAMMDTVEDILIRWHRMLGDPTLWLPGVDHAAIAVHVLIERQLGEEGLTRHDVGRAEFLRRTWEFVNRSRARIFEQHKRLGISTDWTRETFTMDPGPSKAVRTMFVGLFEKGLIYRGNRLINWCPRCQSALSDLEVDHEDETSKLWYVRYPVLNDDGSDSGQFLTVATTRPETMVGDTAVAVHPEDERYRALVGKKLRLPIIGRAIPVIADAAIELEFGTGALKVTPGHDPVDFEIGERHGLAVISAIEPDGRMNAEAGPYEGMDRFDCRDRIVADLVSQGLLEKEEPYTHAVGHCDRCGTIVEPLMSEQWFVAMKKAYGQHPDGRPRSLAGDGILAVTEGWTGKDERKRQVRMIPERFTKVYLNWLENIRDWCISRQLWWGHRIPVWYCDACSEMTVAVEDPDRCRACGSSDIRQDEDTLDTWFSSALWPFSTLGWPEDTEDLRYFYPTSVMETGYEIIFLWVARMIMMGLYAMDDIPFEHVYFHGTVRDDLGQRMSKSKGNGVDPELLIDRYGSDAVRFKLITAAGTGNDQRLEEPRIEAARNFGNKLWNASRFVLSNLEPGQRVPAPASSASLPTEDRWILSRLGGLIVNVDRLMGQFELGVAGREVHDFVWDEFCDWYLEIAKVRLRSADEASPLPVLLHVLDTCLRLLHPYMPYVTEEIWSGSGDLRSHLTDDAAEALMVAKFPRLTPEEYERAWRDEAAEETMSTVIDVVRAVRNIRRERGIDAGKWIEAHIVAADDLRAQAPAIETLARVRPLRFLSRREDAPSQGVATAVLDRAVVVVPMAGLFDVEAERANLLKQRDQARGEVERLRGKLSDERFATRAPAAVVAAERERLSAAESRLERVEARLGELG